MPSYHVEKVGNGYNTILNETIGINLDEAIATAKRLKLVVSTDDFVVRQDPPFGMGYASTPVMFSTKESEIPDNESKI